MWLTLVALTLLCASEPPRWASEVVGLGGAVCLSKSSQAMLPSELKHCQRLCAQGLLKELQLRGFYFSALASAGSELASPVGGMCVEVRNCMEWGACLA